MAIINSDSSFHIQLGLLELGPYEHELATYDHSSPIRHLLSVEGSITRS
jgi:hypothetical protein